MDQHPGEQHAFAEHWPISSLRLGELLLRNRAVQPEALETALRRQESGSRQPIGRLLIELGAINEVTLTRTLAQQFGLPVLYPDREPFDPDAVSRLPADAAFQLQALPIRYLRGRLVIAVAEPPTPTLRPLLEHCAGAPVMLALAPADTLAEAITQRYTPSVTANESAVTRQPPPAEEEQAVPPSTPDVNGHFAGPTGQLIEAGACTLDFVPLDVDPPAQRVPESTDDDPARRDEDGTRGAWRERREYLAEVRTVSWLLARADQLGASSIELHTLQSEVLRIRFRIDGRFQSEFTLSGDTATTLLNRVLHAADLDPPSIVLQEGSLDRLGLASATGARVAAVGSDAGVTALVRLEGSPLEPRGLRDHVAPDTIAAIQRVLAVRHGLVVVGASSPTDRRWLLRALLAEADLPARSVVAIEEPRDDPLAGTTRLLGEPRGSLRAAVALDPDIVVISRPDDSALNGRGVELALGERLVVIATDGEDPRAALARVRACADPFLMSAAVTLIVAAKSAVAGTDDVTGRADAAQDHLTAGVRSMIEVVVVSDELRKAIWHDSQLDASADSSIGET